MSEFPGFELVIIALLILAIVPLLGTYMAYVFSDSRPSIPILSWMERSIYRFSGINPTVEMNWKMYAKALFLFNGLGLFFVWILQLTQQWLPFNPQHFPAVEPFLALNTAISFATNTNWQSDFPEISLSYLTQFLGLTVQNFTSAATGNAVLLALIRGFNRTNGLLGNFWVDVTRTILYLLLPLSLVLSIVLVNQGSIQNFQPYLEAQQWEEGVQTIPMGPVASQVAIKQLGTNGGGFFNSNSAHPFENPNSFSNILEFLAILAIPISSVYMFGNLVHSKSQGYVILGVMSFFFLIALGVILHYEWQPNPLLKHFPVLEGKEQRLGITNSGLWAAATSSVSHGSISSAMDSLSPLAGGASLLLMLTGGIIFGGMGVGLSSMLLHVLLTVFLAGLMVGRSPEYLGKKIERLEIQWTILAILIPAALTLLGSSIALSLPFALASLKNGGPHGFTEMFYAFSSTAVNNGAQFEGLQTNTLFFNLILGFCMLLARFSIITSSLIVAGSLSQKNVIAYSAGTLKTNTLLFGALLAFLLFIITTLTFFPAVALGPVVEHILMHEGQTF